MIPEATFRENHDSLEKLSSSQFPFRRIEGNPLRSAINAGVPRTQKCTPSVRAKHREERFDCDHALVLTRSRRRSYKTIRVSRAPVASPRFSLESFQEGCKRTPAGSASAAQPVPSINACRQIGNAAVARVRREPRRFREERAERL